MIGHFLVLVPCSCLTHPHLDPHPHPLLLLLSRSVIAGHILLHGGRFPPFPRYAIDEKLTQTMVVTTMLTTRKKRKKRKRWG